MAKTPTALANDCFALPPGVNWTPVNEALASLEAALKPVTGTETLPIDQLLGRILSAPVIAIRSNPPAPNSAIDGYGFAHATAALTMQLVDGRAAAGDAYKGNVPAGHAIRILTGAVLPDGVDTVVMQEDCTVSDGQVIFDGPAQKGLNTRKAGEDVEAGEMALPAGHRLRPQDIALMAALGVAQAEVHTPLRVGVLSTGDELVDPKPDTPSDQTFDANRPMLLALAKRWDYLPVDLGHVPDDRDALRERLNAASESCDVVLTSGGASAGDEDHVSALLKAEGNLTHWRIALKPGRPLALAMWQGIPVIGLPGNPVAALVCSLIFARPAFSLLAGAGWSKPQGFSVPASFSKSKKRGRREYLRARLNDEGAAEVFVSEGSGRISGLSWSEGLVELGDDAGETVLGDPVRFLPYGSFGL